MNLLDNLKLDRWYRLVLYLGLLGIIGAILYCPAFIQAKHLFGIGLGMVAIGLAYCIAEKDFSGIKPPNAYTGPAAFMTWKETRHNVVTKLILIAGIGLVGLFGFLIVKGLL